MNNSITKLLITKRPQLIIRIVEKTDATYNNMHTAVHRKIASLRRATYTLERKNLLYENN